MIKKYVFFFIVFYSLNIVAQKKDLPSNPKPGKCYSKCFRYDEKAKWEEVNCDSSRASRTRIKTRKDSIEIEQKKLKMIAYQKKLKNLGYDVDIIGIPDDKTFLAHNKYLKRKKKEDRKRKRKE